MSYMNEVKMNIVKKICEIVNKDLEKEVRRMNAKVLTNKQIERAGEIVKAIHKLEEELKEIYGGVQVEKVKANPWVDRRIQCEEVSGGGK